MFGVPEPQVHRAQRGEDRCRFADRRERLQRFDGRKQIDLAFQRLEITASERFCPASPVISGRTSDQRRRQEEAHVLDGEMERVGLCLDPRGVASCQGVDHRVTAGPHVRSKSTSVPSLSNRTPTRAVEGSSAHEGLRTRFLPIFGRVRTREGGPLLVINSLLTDFTQITRQAQERRQTFERGRTAIAASADSDAIPEAEAHREGAGYMLVRIYHDIGLAAVADALNLLTAIGSRAAPSSAS